MDGDGWIVGLGWFGCLGYDRTVGSGKGKTENTDGEGVSFLRLLLRLHVPGAGMFAVVG